MKRRHITLGALTTANGPVVATSSSGSINGQGIALEGDPIQCPACRSMGFILCIGPRLNETWNGKQVALEGDLCICKCSPRPRLVAAQNMRYQIVDGNAAAAGRSTAFPDVPRFDEQLQFHAATGWPYANLRYTMTLADGSIATGQTDSEGRTERIDTEHPVAITKAEFISDRMHCCERHLDNASPSEPTHVVLLSGVATNEGDVGSSIASITPPDSARSLRSGEIAMARLIFKDSIQYAKVKVHNGPFIIGQNDGTAMTPNGEMYFLRDNFYEDFSRVEADLKLWFIHEMVHVWQFQLGYSVIWHGLLMAATGRYSDRKSYDYDWSMPSVAPLSTYNMEQQGELISHYFGAFYLNDAKFIERIPFLSKVLNDFIVNPNQESLLPK